MAIRNKVVWVTGASSGIGAALVKELAKKGNQVVLSARRRDQLELVREDSGLSLDDALVLPIDLAESEHAEQWLQLVLEKFGRVDVLINNGGVSQKSAALDTKNAVDRQVMEVNFFGGMFLTKVVAKQMVKQGGGQIAAVSSILGKFSLPLLGSYAAAKHAIYGWYEGLRYELRDHNISVQIIAPGFIKTDVALKSLTEDGSALNQNSKAQEKGMPAEKCARRMIRAIKRKRWHTYIGGVEIWMPTVNYYFPKAFFWLMRKLTAS